ncbi:hypothetical protein DTL42_06040 [Bremerella cremea]|uniref:Carboxypeptidase regulatory-like domain-containing protein n=1 Tax=Bremerella cremea TaxID=1031537 RepID=A0A368KWG7_9BACT|nr:hypothetical protein [Bremerella cremea]RCS54686.1 hypothetical protein DTL42_06040 [Bremerella cremea]
MLARKYGVFVLALGTLTLLTVGCGGPKSDKLEMTGKVTLDGQPLQEGAITIEATDDKGGVDGGMITDGEYKVLTTPGDKLIKINATKVVGQKKTYNTPDSPTEDVVKEIIPPKYNTRSDIKVTVTADAASHDFTLESKK